jgi:hypothetical protein
MSEYLTNTDIWEVAIASRLEELSQELEIPITTLPKEADAVVVSARELIDFLFSATEVTGAVLGGLITRETMIVRIYLSDRYSSDLNEKKAINFVAHTLRGKLHGAILGSGASTPLKFQSQRLYAPEGNTWYMEQTYVFEAIASI